MINLQFTSKWIKYLRNNEFNHLFEKTHYDNNKMIINRLITELNLKQFVDLLNFC